MDFGAYLKSLRPYFQRDSTSPAENSDWNQISVWKRYPKLSKEIYNNAQCATADQLQENIHLLLPPFLNMLDDVTPISVLKARSPIDMDESMPKSPAIYATMILQELVHKCPPSFLRQVGLWDNVVLNWTTNRATAMLLFSSNNQKSEREKSAETELVQIVTSCWLEILRASILLEGSCETVKADKFGIIVEPTAEKVLIAWLSCMDMNVPAHVRQVNFNSKGSLSHFKVYACQFVVLLLKIGRLALKHAKVTLLSLHQIYFK